MRIVCNGTLFPEWVSVKVFKKAAYLLRLKYDSFEGGEWIEIEQMDANKLLNAIR